MPARERGDARLHLGDRRRFVGRADGGEHGVDAAGDFVHLLFDEAPRGDRRRPEAASQDLDAWNSYVYGRLNPAGDHNEIWQHSGGCRIHLRVVRNTLTHEMSSPVPVREPVGASSRKGARS